MAFDNEKWNTPVTGGDIGAPLIAAVRALVNIEIALTKIAEKIDIEISEELEEVRKARGDIDEAFDEMTGYTADET
jgi:hypothetical protein